MRNPANRCKKTDLVPFNLLKAQWTDIWGFIAAAADRIHAEHSPERQPVIIITSDMKDNCKRNIAKREKSGL